MYSSNTFIARKVNEMKLTQKERFEKYLQSSPSRTLRHSVVADREVFRDIYDRIATIEDVAELMNWTVEDTRDYYEQWKPK